jgi:hypothetical protein
MAVANVEAPIMGAAHHDIVRNQQALGKGIVGVGTGVLDRVKFIPDPEKGDGKPIQGDDPGPAGRKFSDFPGQYFSVFDSRPLGLRHVIDAKGPVTLEDILLRILGFFPFSHAKKLLPPIWSIFYGILSP